MKDCDGYFFVIYDVPIEKAMNFGHNGDKQPAWLKDRHGDACKFLCRLNCDIGQGFLAGKAMKVEDYGKRYIKGWL